MFKKITTFLITISIFLTFPHVIKAFGITPGEINVQNLTPGSHYETEVYVMRPADEVDEALKVVLEPALGEMDSWFTYEPGREFNFPAGKSNTTFKVIVDVPKDVALKTYKGQITAKGLSDKKAEEGVTIIKGAVVLVDFTTTNVTSSALKVLSITAPEVESGDPVRLTLNIENSGNSKVSPDAVNLEIMDLFEKPLESLSDTSLEAIDPFTTKEIQAEFNSNLEKGQYRIDASVIFNGKEIARQKMVLTVNAKPAKTAEELAVPVTAAKASLSVQIGLLLAILGLALLLIVLLLYARKEKVNDPDFEKRIIKLMHKNMLITWILVGTSIVLVGVGMYLYLSQSVNTQTQTLVNTPIEEVVSPTVTPIDTPAITPTPVKSVKGISTEAKQPATPLVVERQGTPGLYQVYSEPSFESVILYEAKDGETFNVINQQGDWYNVKLSDGTSGWLHKSSIKSSN